MNPIDWNLLARYISGEANDKQKEQVKVWLLERRAHRQLLDDLTKVWQARSTSEQRFDSQTAFNKLTQRIASEDRIPSSVPDRRLLTTAYRWRLTGAAAIILLLLIPIFMFLNQSQEPVKKISGLVGKKDFFGAKNTIYVTRWIKSLAKCRNFS
ncbi:MAG: hypothetical protein HC880_07820 [Bacteroidia bacterium]|nr:hypothetical protein [Bacteroidia bacterium]